ncbi:MAG: hypothetical protein ACE5HQ_13680, partial [Gemmatimonadota bacterium]
MFDEHGLSGREIVNLVRAMREYESPRRLRPGTVVRFAMAPPAAIGPAQVGPSANLTAAARLTAAASGPGTVVASGPGTGIAS